MPSRTNRRRVASTRTVSAGGCPGPGSLGPSQCSITVAIRSKILRSNSVPFLWPKARGGDRDVGPGGQADNLGLMWKLPLRRKVGGFVHCAIAAERGDGSLEGFCSTAGRGVLDPRTDLGAWLIEQGFALAGDLAPPEYISLERLAEAQGRGLWADLSGYRRRRR